MTAYKLRHDLPRRKMIKELEPKHLYVDKLFSYYTDGLGRVVKVVGCFDNNFWGPGDDVTGYVRNKVKGYGKAESGAGGERCRDVAFHIAAKVFRGCPELYNLIPASPEWNIWYRNNLENKIRFTMRETARFMWVNIRFLLEYPDERSRRPSRMQVTYRINGNPENTEILELEKEIGYFKADPVRQA